MSRPSGTFTTENPDGFSDDNSNRTQEISQIEEQNVVKEMVGLDLGKSSNNKQKNLRSDVWENFEKYKDENGNDRAKCNICKKSYNGSSKMGTTHLRNHFKSCSQNKSNEGRGRARGDKPAENSVMDRVKMLIKQSSGFEPLPNSIEEADLTNVYNEEMEKLRIYFGKLRCRLSLMINTYVSRYICFSVHFIDDDWKLKEKIISLKCIGGDPIMKILENVLSEWGINNNISYMILDGDSYDNVMSSNERKNWFSSQGSLLFNGKLFYVRDFHYMSPMYSACIDEIEGVLFLYDRMKEIFNHIKGNGNFRIAIDRVRSLGKKVTTGVIPTEQDLDNMDQDERVVYLVEIALGLKEAFFELENMDIEFKSINLTKEEWDLITTFYDLKDETLWYDNKTANMYFPWLCSKYMIYLELVELDSVIPGVEYIEEGIACWYDGNLVLAIAAVLDPRFKLDIVKHWYKKIYGGECETRLAKFTEYLTRVYNEYARDTNDFQSSTSGSKEKKSAVSYEMLDPSGKLHKFSHDHLDHHRSSNFELHLYLEDVKFPLIREFNILDWWRSNTQYFPTLARMARDFLSIQITIPDGYFDSRIPSPSRDLDFDMVNEAFVCARDWLKS